MPADYVSELAEQAFKKIAAGTGEEIVGILPGRPQDAAADLFPRSPFERSRFVADAIACSKQGASETRDVHTNRTPASASRVLQNGLSRVTMRRS
jgi:hypothetical protein